ncbi:MAG TPA: copper amine oxidase N-terminal domain-containing protein [Epulopiscium sp.]|nr:copper amine oxidase N-terminal domain-containing protein [Candidatus Epulonipiscium sp.]
MKMRKRIAALIAVAMIAALMPMSAFAASRNRVQKVVTVEKDSVIKKGQEPDLRIRLDDELSTNQSFYLHLDGAEWISVDDLIARFPANEAAKVNDDIFHFVVKDRPLLINGDQIFEAHREGGETLAIRYLLPGSTVNGTEVAGPAALAPTTGNPNENFEFIFPMAAEVTGDEAIVKIQMYDTTITNTDHLFAVSDGVRAKVVMGDAPGFYRTTEIAEIRLEETYANSIKEVPLNERWFTLELRNTDFMFNVDTTKAEMVGERAYRTGTPQKFTADNYELSNDRTRLGIKIEDGILDGAFNERGNIKITGIEVVAARDAKNGPVIAVMDSKKLFDKQDVTVAKHGDYGTTLKAEKDYKVVAGNEIEVEFTLSEDIANSLVGSRPATFTFGQGVKIKTGTTVTSDDWEDYKADDILWGDYSLTQSNAIIRLLDEIETLKAAIPVDTTALNAAKLDLISILGFAGKPVYSKPGKTALTGLSGVEVKGSDVDDLDKDDWSDTARKNRIHIADNHKSFTVDNFNLVKDKAGSYTFKTTLLVPANVVGDVTLEVSGKGLTEETITILDVEAPITVEEKGIDIKVGLKEIETEGRILIKETAEERLAQGKDIVLRVDDIDNGLKIKSFDYKVVEGDLVLDDDYGTWKSGDQAIGVKRVSTEASTIEITNIVMFTDRTVPEGKYDLLIGGDAISRITKDLDDDIDAAVVLEDFINITTKNTEDIAGSANKAKVSFVVGSNEYLVNGKVETMDVAPYIKDGRTMVPVRYVAAALGVRGDQVIWDQVNQTATVLADKTIQVKLGSKMMVIDGVSVPMTAAAELTSDRTFVPVAEIARALNVPTAWDTENATATFN